MVILIGWIQLTLSEKKINALEFLALLAAIRGLNLLVVQNYFESLSIGRARSQTQV
jgi:hypothetical protein